MLFKIWNWYFWPVPLVFFLLVFYRFSEFVSNINNQQRKLNGIKIMHQFIWIYFNWPTFFLLFSLNLVIRLEQPVFIDWIYDKMLIIKIVNKIRHSLVELTCFLMTASMQINFTWEFHIDRITEWMSHRRVEKQHTKAYEYIYCVRRIERWREKSERSAN